MSLTLINEIPTYSFADNPIWVVIESGDYSGSEPPFEPDEPNQRIILSIFTFKPGFQDEKEARLSLAISPFTKRAFANVAATFNLQITPPDPDTIVNPTIELTAEENGWRLYLIQAYKQFGLPPEEEETPSLVIGSTTAPDLLYAIKGGLPLDAVNIINPLQSDGDVKLLHLLLGNIYLDTPPLAAEDYVIRPATKEMPSWMYVFTTFDDPYDLLVTVGFSDGSTNQHTFTGLNSFEGINYIPVGWDQLDLDTNITTPTGAKPEYYFVSLVDAGTTTGIGMTMLFQLHECQPFTRYILMETGLGGLETVPLFGKHAYGVESSRETTRMTTTIDTTPETGNYANFNRQTNRVITAQTGYSTKNYIDLLSQLLCGELWEIDIKGERFLKIAADQQTFRELYKEDDDLYALEFKYRQGWDDPHSIKI